jgi:hypothetical protein
MVALFQQPQREVVPQELDLEGNTFIFFLFQYNCAEQLTQLFIAL